MKDLLPILEQAARGDGCRETQKREIPGIHHATGGDVLMHLLCKCVIWFHIPELLQSAKEDILG